jgi:hypothetical protein
LLLKIFKNWGKGGEMTQTLYAHMNKKIFKNRLGTGTDQIGMDAVCQNWPRPFKLAISPGKLPCSGKGKG